MEKRMQRDRWTSSWSRRELLMRWAFVMVWTITCAWTPKKLHVWRNLILRVFGAKIQGVPFVSPSARIHFPWNLQLAHRACIAERADIYSLALISVGRRAVISKDAFLCCGSHDFDSLKCELTVAPINIYDDAFIGARAIVLPGCHIGASTIVGAGAVVTSEIPSFSVAGGNPARVIKARPR